MARMAHAIHQNINLLFVNHTNSPQILHSIKSAPSLHVFYSSPLLLSSLSLSCSTTTRVSISPVECATPLPDFDFISEISSLRSLRSRIRDSNSFAEKCCVIDSDFRVRNFFSGRGRGLEAVLSALGLDAHLLFLLKCVVAAGQEHVLDSSSGFLGGESDSTENLLKSSLNGLAEMIAKWDATGDSEGLPKKIEDGLNELEIRALNKLFMTLQEVEQFYDCIGGIIGYQLMVLELLNHSATDKKATNWFPHIQDTMKCKYFGVHTPGGLDLSKNKDYASQVAIWGIEGLPFLGEIYPLGGSADRLGLTDPDTGECLPAAMLHYCGRTLLEGHIRDLQAREFLYFKIFGKQCITPVAIMTSSAKKNHDCITSLCERLRWFGRSRSSFLLFEQPLVPTVSTEDGKWLVAGAFMPVCKPGGHGVIWKLAQDKGVFHWFRDKGRKGAIVRQVSNVVAATDVTLLALAGMGLRSGKKLGFASCKRNQGAMEGINVLIEKKNSDESWSYGFSCIEYTELDKYGVDSFQVEFPANANLLYVDLASAEQVGSSNNATSLPGMVLNVRKPVVFEDNYGIQHQVFGGRLECTMQNIADNFFKSYSSRCYKVVENELDTFIVYNRRRMVTSSAKKKRKHADSSLHQTPEGSLLDVIRNARDLLSECDIKIPEIEGNEKYADYGPPFLIFLHPALGPLWQVTRQKFCGGSISKGSELQVEVSEFLWRNVEVDGSMIIVAENVMGATRINNDGEPILHYGHKCGRCRLENVKVLNEGINWDCNDNIYWKHQVERFESLKIILNGNAEFEAADVTIQGNHVFEIPDGFKMQITQGKQGLLVGLDALEGKMVDGGSWFWNYSIKDASHIHLEMIRVLK